MSAASSRGFGASYESLCHLNPCRSGGKRNKIDLILNIDSCIPRFIQCDPNLHPVSEPPITYSREPLKVHLGLLNIQPTVVPVLQRLWEVPVIESYPGPDTSGDEPSISRL
jgi:hypothetical protein